LKELVNNSYDADAPRVEIFVKPDADRIIVSDDGVGLSRVEFENHFQRISESHKRDAGDITDGGRPMVGKIGIGFIAANELCDVMEIVSTKAGSVELLRVEVRFAEMRRDPVERRREGDSIAKGDYTGVVGKAARDEHYTHVLLKQVRPNAKGILAGALKREHAAGDVAIYGKSPETIRKLISSDAVADWGDLDDYSQTMLRVGLNVPVRYLPNWYPPEHKKVLAPLERQAAALKFAVFCDGSDLRKPVVLESGDRNLLQPLHIDGDHVSARGYLFTKHRVLRPQWLNGVLIRIRHAAVGEYDATFLGFKSSEQTLFQRWTSCEIWADDRLEEALNIDRRTLRITHPAFVELQEAFHDHLSDFLTQARRVLYTAPAAQKREKEARAELERFTEVVAEQGGLASKTRRDLVRAVEARKTPERTSRPSDVRAVLRKYTVAEMYDTALDVAREVLSERDYDAFARALAERLLR
jgi:hypothetical protein